jgi:hypothetical protein
VIFLPLCNSCVTRTGKGARSKAGFRFGELASHLLPSDRASPSTVSFAVKTVRPAAVSDAWWGGLAGSRKREPTRLASATPPRPRTGSCPAPVASTGSRSVAGRDEGARGRETHRHDTPPTLADQINSSVCAPFAQSDTDSIRVRSSQASPWGTGEGSKLLAKLLSHAEGLVEEGRGET